MKKIIFFLSGILLWSSISFCQPYAVKRHEVPLERAKEYRRESIISLGIGTAMILGGIWMTSKSDPEELGDNNEVIGNFCIYAGTVIEILGLTKFIVNQKRINKIMKVVADTGLDIGLSCNCLTDKTNRPPFNTPAGLSVRFCF